MSLLELGGRTFTISVGEVMLGSDASCAISLTGAGVLPQHAVLQAQADGQVVIRGASLVFGREAGCDVVVPGKDVSRRHAEIVQTPKGYLLVDSSTNGTFVNEEQVAGQRFLARADVIRLGDEQFRFYADVAPAAGPPAAEAGNAAERLKHTVHGMDAVAPPPPPARPLPPAAPPPA